jgi:DNA-binding MarR family transcriptional regulator
MASDDKTLTMTHANIRTVFMAAPERGGNDPIQETMSSLQRFFEVSPPSVHRMVLELERKGLIRRQPGRARSIELLVAVASLPILR